MEMQALLFVALGGQLLTETGPVTLPEAQSLVKMEVHRHINTDAEAAKKIPLRLLELKQAGMLKREYLGSIVQDLVRQHYTASSCKLLPLPEAIFNDRYGNISQRDLLRIFYPLHTDQQEDGWSCGFRSDFSVAALRKALQTSAVVLSHEDLGHACRELREKAPGLKQSIEYIILRSKLDAVVSLLRSSEKGITEGLEILRKEAADCIKVLLQIQPDYFILKVAREFLRENSPLIFDAISLLGKATNKEVKAFSSELVNLLVRRLQDDNARLVRVNDIVVQIFSMIEPLVNANSDFDLKQFVSWAVDITKHRAEILALALKSGHVGVRRQVEALCKINEPLKLLFEELETELCAVDLNGLDLHVIRGHLDNYAQPSLQAFQNNLCEADSVLKATCRVLERATCPKFRAALALFNTAEPVNDEIITLLRASTHPRKGLALTCIDEKEHMKIQSCIVALKALLYKYRRDNVEQIIAQLSQVKDVQQVKRAIELLGGKKDSEEGEDPELNKTLHEAKQLLEEVDRQKIVGALKILEPTCCFERTKPHADVMRKLCEELEEIKDSSISVAIMFLKHAQTQQEALKAVALIENGNASNKKDALALLHSDHTAGAAWSVSDDCVLAAESIRTLKMYMPAEGALATAENLKCLAGMPVLGLPRENVHILGDFLKRGLLFDFSDPILDSGISDAERTELEKCTSREQQSALVEDAIKKHFREHYIEKGPVSGAHYFICNITRPAEHWIVVAVVKFAHKKPILVVLDSKNYAIQPKNSVGSVGADTVIAFLYNRFIRPFNV